MRKATVNPAYLDFIRYSVGEETVVPESIECINWEDFLEFCNRQGITGLVFNGIQKADIRFNQSALLEWIGTVQMIIRQNTITNKRLRESVVFFERKGLRSCILKGQANGLMYPKPELRSPGDVDIWVEGKREDIIKEVRNVCPNAHYSIHHIKLPIFKDVSVEVHYRPIYMSNWFMDRKLQNYIGSVEKRQFASKVALNNSEIGCLTDDFNAIYQLLHMYHHFFETRNNFKQFIDYYMLLKRGHFNNTDIAQRFRELGVLKYAKGVMWVMKEVLALEEKYLVVEPCEKEGRLILSESSCFGTFPTNNLLLVIDKFWANLRVMIHYPMEVMISPLFLIWHQWWRLKMSFALK